MTTSDRVDWERLTALLAPYRRLGANEGDYSSGVEGIVARYFAVAETLRGDLIAARPRVALLERVAEAAKRVDAVKENEYPPPPEVEEAHEALYAAVAALSEHAETPMTTSDREPTCGPRDCPLPDLPYGQVAIAQRPDWTCGNCRRVWRHNIGASGGQWWVEVQGPSWKLGVR